ncbi:MAG: YigZ family protein [bacterium]|nr:YigZ family protein [bacterium]MCP4800529.1 YigZ family protein [bacterium]
MTTPNHKLPGYKVLSCTADAEMRVKRSRFIAHIAAVESEDDARSAVKEMEKKYHDSRHVCFAWILGYGEEIKYHSTDAGEPSGSAGEPILGVLKKHEVTNAVAIVVRYFGGIKLGTGGLGRAYKECAALALEKCETKFIAFGNDFEITFPYHLLGSIEHSLEKHDGKVVQRNFDEDVNLLIWLPEGREQSFDSELNELSSGTIKLKARP